MSQLPLGCLVLTLSCECMPRYTGSHAQISYTSLHVDLSIIYDGNVFVIHANVYSSVSHTVHCACVLLDCNQDWMYHGTVC